MAGSENWDDFRFFLAVAQGGSLAAAGRRIGASQATVWRRIAALEARLGLRLFESRRGGYALSPAGARLLDPIQRVESELFAVRRALDQGAQAHVSGEIRLTAPEFLAAGLLSRRLQQLRRNYPELHIELITASPFALVSRQETDLAFRFERPSRGSFVPLRAFDVGFAVYASRGYLKQFGGPPALDRFEGHALIDFDMTASHIAPSRWLRQGGRGATIAFRSNSPHARMTAAKAGVGLAMLPCLIGDAESALQRIIEPEELGALQLWLLVDGRVQHHPRTSVTRDFLLESLAEAEDDLRGRFIP